MSELYSRNGDKLTINLHTGQTMAWDSKARFPAIIAGTQSGKTSFLPLWLDREMRICGEGDYLGITSTYDLFKIKFLPEMKNYFVDGFGWEWAASERVISKAKTRIILRSADTKGGLEAATAKGAVFDECGQDRVRLGAWEAVQRRLSLNAGRCLLATTPYNIGWLKTEVYDRWASGDPGYDVINFKSTMNPNFPQAEYNRMKRILPAWKFHMFYDGTFERPAGLVYSDFDSDTQKVKPFDIPQEWPRYVGIDFGAVNTAVVWIALDPNTNCYYIYRCVMMGGKTTKEKAIMSLTYKHENTIRWTGGAKSETQERMDWNAEGVPVQESPIISVEAGIDRVIELLKTKRLFVFDTLKGLLDELGTYSRVLDDRGQPTEKIKDKNDYHRLDAVRYNISAVNFSTTGGINV